MKFYNDFSSMFNAQSGVKSDMSVFNFVKYEDEFDAYVVTLYDSGTGDYYSNCSVYPNGCEELDSVPVPGPYPYTLILTDSFHPVAFTEDDLRSALNSVGFHDIDVFKDPGGGFCVSGTEPLGQDIAKRVAETLSDKYDR